MRTRYMAEPVVKIANESRTLPRKKKKKKKPQHKLIALYSRNVISCITRTELNALSKLMVIRARSSGYEVYSRDCKFSSQCY